MLSRVSLPEIHEALSRISRIESRLVRGNEIVLCIVAAGINLVPLTLSDHIACRLANATQPFEKLNQKHHFGTSSSFCIGMIFWVTLLQSWPASTLRVRECIRRN
jgi:hypothetical protein